MKKYKAITSVALMCIILSSCSRGGGANGVNQNKDTPYRRSTSVGGGGGSSSSGGGSGGGGTSKKTKCKADEETTLINSNNGFILINEKGQECEK